MKASRSVSPLLAAAAALSTCLVAVPVFANDGDALEQAFRDPPAGTRSIDGYFADVPQHNGYDLMNATAVTELLKVQDGMLVSPGGARYRLLYLAGTSTRMTVPVLRRIAQLVQAGATVVGDAPVASPSLADNPREFAHLVKRLWRGRAVTKLGKGRVIAGKDLRAALSLTGVAPDFVAAGSDGPNANKIGWTAGEMYRADAPLRSPGLIGPVMLVEDVAQ